MTREEREYFYRKLQKMFAEWAASHETTPDVNNALIKTFADRYMGSVTGQQPLPQELFRVFLSELKLPSGGQSADDILISSMRKDIEDNKKNIGTMNFGPSLEEHDNITGAIARLGEIVGETDHGEMDKDFMGNMSILSYLKFIDTVLDVRELEHLNGDSDDTTASILLRYFSQISALQKLVGAGDWGNNFIDGDNLSFCVEELSRYLGYADDWTTQSKYTTVYNAIDSITNSISSLSSRVVELENDCGASDGELKGLTTGQAFDYLITKINDLHALLK
jgi:hypothetical protein